MSALTDIRDEIEKVGEYDGMMARPEDALIFREVQEDNDYRGLVQPGDRVLDIGAHIGIFAKYAVEQGAASVLCLEPQPDNFAYLRENVNTLVSGGADVTCVEVAVSSHMSVWIYGFGMNAGIIKRHGRHKYEVPGVTLGELISAGDFNVMKMDIEGGEFDALASASLLQLATLDRAAIEYHPRKEWMLNAMAAQHGRLRKAGLQTPRDRLTPPSKPNGRGRVVRYAQA